MPTPKRSPSKRRMDRYIETLLSETGLREDPTIDAEWSLLREQLGGAQLASLACLLERALLLSHRVRHLPGLQAYRAIRASAELLPAPRVAPEHLLEKKSPSA